MRIVNSNASAAGLRHLFTARLGVAFALSLIFVVGGCNSPVQPPPVARNERPSRPETNAYPSRAGSSDYPEDRPRRRSRRGRPQQQVAPGQFDFYLLNLSWSPEFCATHGDSPECGRHLGFVVHGLWPQDTDGDYPENCSDAPGPANPQADTDIFPTASLVAHEWETHGTCSGLNADDYFAVVHKAYAAVKLPANIGLSGDANGVTPNALLARLAAANAGYPAGSFALSCGNNRLTAIEICLTKSLQPEACDGVRSCRANVVQVTPQ